MERTLGRRIYDRNIKLYTQDYCFPNWAKHKIKWRKYNEFKKIEIDYRWRSTDYQFEAMWHVAEYEWGLIEAPTGSWKSHIVMRIANYFKAKTLIICPTKKLVKEMYDKFKEFTNYVPWTYYSDGKDIRDITITTHASFTQDIGTNNNLKWFNIVIVDEADDKLSTKMIEAICKCDCDILVGMTGTPNRQDLHKEDLVLVFWPYIQVWEYQMLPNKIRHHIYRRDNDEAGSIDYTNRHTQRESILNNNVRFETVVKNIKEITDNHYISLILLDRHTEIEKYSEQFPNALVITWHTKIADDEAGIERLKRTGWIIIGSIKKMYRWVDIPEVDNVIIASPIRFNGTVIQSIGRALRSHPDKKSVSIDIINDNVLMSQKQEQTKICKETYKVIPQNFYLEKSKWPTPSQTSLFGTTTNPPPM